MTTEPAPANDVDDLAAALRQTEQVIAGVATDQTHAPTPCTDYDVEALVGHLVGYATHFADRAQGVDPASGPGDVAVGEDAAATYRAAADRLVEGYREPAEGATPLGVVVMETVVHGWDLARATGQSPSYPDGAVESALALGQSMLSDEYRGEGKPFGTEVAADASATPVDRLVAFLGRDPGWTPG